ncbi:MAG: hypothetical protein R3B90_00630 [Planctomycetaceae bacterium]
MWFYHYKKLPPPATVPEAQPTDLFKNPTTTLLLVVVGIFGVVALVAVAKGAIVAIACCFAAIGFAAFGYLRHVEARRIEQTAEHQQEVLKFASQALSRLDDAVARYNALLRTGNARIEAYYQDIYEKAERERQQSEGLRREAHHDRLMVKSVEKRIYDMAERLVGDHLKWMTHSCGLIPKAISDAGLRSRRSFSSSSLLAIHCHEIFVALPSKT